MACLQASRRGELRELAGFVPVIRAIFWRAAIGGMACLYWVPLVLRSLAMGTYGLSYGEGAHCPLPPGQASALAGWPRARIQSVSEFWIMHA